VVVLIGNPGTAHLGQLEDFLRRNGYPYTAIDAAQSDGRAMVERLGVEQADLPLMICPNGSLLKRPTETEAALCLGMTPELDAGKVYDVAVVGAGPAGLAAAVYAGSEGLSVIVLDSRAFGGQAGASSRIENYLGFPTGISGLALMGRAFNQALKFGVEIAIPVTVERLDCGDEDCRLGAPHRLVLSNGAAVHARTVVVASGAAYRRPPIENLSNFEGAGVSYWASPVEAKLCEGEEVALVGGGNSAGQAVVFLAPKVKKLHLVVRGEGLESSMSRYLIDRIAALPNVELHTKTEVVGLEGNEKDGLTGAMFRCKATGETHTCHMRHLFLFIGGQLVENAAADRHRLLCRAVSGKDEKLVAANSGAKCCLPRTLASHRFCPTRSVQVNHPQWLHIGRRLKLARGFQIGGRGRVEDEVKAVV
jgi:thioredoxin reductase (NADPH)